MFGVMQGRLLEKYKGRYQAHPCGYWQREFHIAERLDLCLIEFILDHEELEENPLMHKNGIREIRRISNETGVLVKSVCADNFMRTPLHDPNEKLAQKSVALLIRVLKNLKALQVTDVVLPCVDDARFRNQKAIDRFVERARDPLDLAVDLEINLALETDLAPRPFASLIERLNCSRATVNYDIGNSAANGYCVDSEFDAYGSRITNVHLKDRKLSGSSVLLGSGDADFPTVFTRLRKLCYRGPLIMQAYRDDEGLAVFQEQLEWANPFVNSLLR
jgi:sugar phosphate isomerase/epimerase